MLLLESIFDLFTFHHLETKNGEKYSLTYQPALAQSEEPEKDQVLGALSPDGGDAGEDNDQDEGEGNGDVEQDRVLVGEGGHLRSKGRLSKAG